jgi:hypothetical protein
MVILLACLAVLAGALGGREIVLRTAPGLSRGYGLHPIQAARIALMLGLGGLGTGVSVALCLGCQGLPLAFGLAATWVVTLATAVLLWIRG